ncbi:MULTISPECIES: hypothetical protein [Vagococcus]|uniref:Uncharacterized protein n=1 Tax=Vagococcus fluvialis bH819 TaxID=1255619 RepID=A0A1X6WPT7_9ENTE|nr:MULTISPECIES: hypothetical protein [Vagococcus]SLM86305.1 hypothetical protein FM121_09460 [Vagococcus fluvialis bH819]HCM88870.1 hypothetical protein [Vagococcus sp.]
MNNTKKGLFALPFIISVTLLQTTISLLPGVLFLRDSSRGPAILTYMVLYLLLSDFFQLIGKASYKKGTFISIPVYGMKLVASCVLIFMISKQTAYQFALILLAYELFQLLIFSKQFFYIDSIFYSILNAFFKGIVFNQLLTINYPFNYNFDLIKPFIFAFSLILFITILTQGMYSFLSRQSWFFILALLSLGFMYYLLITQYLNQETVLWKLIIFGLCNIGAVYFFLKSKNAKKKELILNLFALISLFIYYF